jgi:acetyltransferase-like isoleucine patch superfamily enzyme
VPMASRIREAVRNVLKKVRRQYFILAWKMQIGEGSVISFSARLDKTNPRGVHIGSHTVVAFGASILTHDFVHGCAQDVYIGNNCFIGANATILPGVRIGDNCIVSAASFVFRDVPSGSLVAGNPARVVETNIRTGRYGVRVGWGSIPAPEKPLELRPKKTLRATVMSEIRTQAEFEQKTLPTLSEDSILLECGLDSLTIAILVARLEDSLRIDPFSSSGTIHYPITLGDFIRMYESAANVDE